jgi:hypothetical protein
MILLLKKALLYLLTYFTTQEDMFPKWSSRTERWWLDWGNQRLAYLTLTEGCSIRSHVPIGCEVPCLDSVEGPQMYFLQIVP